MFVRKKRNTSGTISVQVIDKSSGWYKVLKTIGSSTKREEIDKLLNEAHDWIKIRTGKYEIDFLNEEQTSNSVLENIKELTVSGPEKLLGKIFDEIGFNKIPDELFRKLVIARLCFPVSKLKTTDYFSKYQFFEIDVQNVYRYLDKLYNIQKQTVQQISYEHTLKILNNGISIVFYDVTTLYFEIDSEDDLRKRGFSKEGKHHRPQILLGLLVSIDGYPLAYEIFEGNKFEGHTMLPVIEEFKRKYKLSDLIIIADSGLFSNQNITELQEKGYQYIIGARIKNEKDEIKKRILSLNLGNGKSEIIQKSDEVSLIVSYSEARAGKDKLNRDRGITRLEKTVKSGKLTKSSLNKRGYNKFLKIENEVKVTIDESKIKEDSKWDGLKGYLTNTKLSKQEIIENYNELWKIEKAFRIAKTDLAIRPIYHRLRRRIEAHICISFVAYKLYKELERQLRVKKAGISPEKAIEIAKTIYTIKLKTPTNRSITKTLYLRQEQIDLVKLFDL